MKIQEIKDQIEQAPSVRGVKKWVTKAMKLGPGKTWDQKDTQELAKSRIRTLRRGRMGRVGHIHNGRDMSW